MGNRTKNRVISFRVTPEIYDEIHSKADAAGEGLSAYLTDAALGKEIIQFPDLRDFTKELKRQGTNLNQLTMLAHMGRIRSPGLESAANLYAKLLTEVKKLNERRRR